MKTLAIVTLLALVCLSFYPSPTFGEMSVKRPSLYGEGLLDDEYCKFGLKFVAKIYACLLPHQSREGRTVRSAINESGPSGYQTPVSRMGLPVPWWLLQEDTQDAVTDEGTCEGVFKYFAKRSGCPFPQSDCVDNMYC